MPDALVFKKSIAWLFDCITLQHAWWSCFKCMVDCSAIFSLFKIYGFLCFSAIVLITILRHFDFLIVGLFVFFSVFHCLRLLPEWFFALNPFGIFCLTLFLIVIKLLCLLFWSVDCFLLFVRLRGESSTRVPFAGPKLIFVTHLCTLFLLRV